MGFQKPSPHKLRSALIENIRVLREMHDGVIQNSLRGIDMNRKPGETV